jgi:hypothetical protein
MDDFEKARIKIGEQFRQKHNIQQDHTAVFLSPGDTVEENEYSLEAFSRGFNEFILKNSYPTSLSKYATPKSNFGLIISVHKEQRAKSM